MLEYIVLHDTGASSLAEKVNYYINDGWQPQGGVMVTQVDFGPGLGKDVIWAQAMVR